MTPTETTFIERLERFLSVRAYGFFTSACFGAYTPPLTMRARFERFGAVSREKLQRKHPGLSFSDLQVGGRSMERVCAGTTPRASVLHLHGGAYFMGSPACYRSRTMRLSYRMGAEVFVPDYRLAPEHPYPAALDDAVEAYRVVAALRPSLPIVVTGDSAGGGLALALMMRLRTLRERRPDAAILLSPWADLTTSGASVDSNAGRDLWFTRAHLEHWAQHYLAGQDAADPLVSPVFGDLRELPPMLVFAGEDELLLDDARRVVERAPSARLHVGPGMQHDWPLTLPWLRESRHAWAQMVQFVDERVETSTRARSSRPVSRARGMCSPRGFAGS